MLSAKSKSLAFLLALLQVALPSQLLSAPLVTSPVVLDDQPINTSSTVKPNIVFTLDNSGSMDATYAPEETESKSNYGNTAGKRCYVNSSYNRLYYNPDYTYLPPILGDGTRMPNANYVSAWLDGFHTSDGIKNLGSAYSQPGYYGRYNDNFDRPTSFGHYAQFIDTTVVPANTVPIKGQCYDDSKYVIVNMNTGSTPADDVKRQNFANWFSYYRSRLMAMKSSAGEAFRVVGDEFRVGFHTIDGVSNNSSYGGFLPVDTFTGQHRNDWYTMFYRQYAWFSTPLRPALTRIGEYFRTGARPGGGTVADPIQYSCQPNYHILSTDGYWNGGGGGGVAGSTNWNNTLPSTNPELLTALTTEFGTPFLPGQPWPKPYREKVGAASNDTLADIAAYYWQTDLRPTAGYPNNVATSAKDPASWQHVTQFTLALSPQGTIPYPSGLASIKAGTLEWPTPAAQSPTSVDDLWAAAVVGHGEYFNVSSPEELLNKLGGALADIAGRQTSGTPSASTSIDYETANAPYVYRASYKPGEWSGKLEVRAVNADTGGAQGPALWDAAAQLDLQVSGVGWDTGRKIATMNTGSIPNVPVPFRWANLSTAQKDSLDSVTTKSQDIVEYLRGNRAKEDNAPATSIPAPTSTVGTFRQRSTVLGAIINSKPHYEAGPSGPLLDAFNPGYSAFKAAKATRTPTLYVGASDGMLHAFDATVGNLESGREKWAYVPGMTYKSGADGLASWAWRYADPLPKKFTHRFRVDQSPVVTDVDFGKAGTPTGTPDWRTILVAGMNKGGKGFYALDVTNPDAANEADVVAKVLWEFTGETANDPKMGYSFGEPAIFKTKRFGWVVAVTSGYNNVAGTGHLWLLNPKTGAVLHRFNTPAHSNGSPSGLGQVNGFRLSDRDNIVEQLYAGDLLGKVWRFDVSSTAPADWIDPPLPIASISEPITTRPVISIDPFNPKNRWVVFGSGKLLSQADASVANSSTNSTFFAVKDGSKLAPNGVTTPITKADLVQVALADTKLLGENVKGWYINMTGYGQIDLNPEIRRGRVFWSSNAPASTPCSKGFDGFVFARLLGSGGNVIAGATVIPVDDGVAGLNLVKVKRVGTNLLASQSALTLRIDSRGGGSNMNSSASFKTPLYGGRSNFRYVTLQ
jgi:type IV pilus assembly protein PilY1